MYKLKEKYVRSLMAAKGLKHKDMARLTHLTPVGWRLFLKGTHKARVDTALVVATALGTTVENMFEKI